MSSKKGKVQEAIDQKLLEERKVFLWGMVEDDSAKHVIDRLLYLDMQSNEEIQLFIMKSLLMVCWATKKIIKY